MATQAPATNWPGGSYDPETHTLYVASQSAVAALGLVPPPAGDADVRYHQGTVLSGARTLRRLGCGAGRRARRRRRRRLDVQGLPLIKPPYGRINAIDLDKGDIVWQVAARRNAGPRSAITRRSKGLTIPRTGRPGIVGTLVTKTLLIAGEPGFGPTPSGQRGSMLRAYDKATGKEVGAVYMPAPQTRLADDLHAQRPAVPRRAISGGAYTGELLALRLPS